MEIKKLEAKDIEPTVELWYKVSVTAHPFVPAAYWRNNKEAMATIYLPTSETYVSIEDDKIVGFIAMAENYLAALFVDNKLQGKGIGKTLLNFIKGKRTVIHLKVFKKNIKSIEFYQSQCFNIVSENKDKETGELEFLMEWRKNPAHTGVTL
ncbi:N-acetyltransferase [Pontibacter sp. 13R65]|uniref:N-acetyltransferase n=1 Tax=Pontibacter sp. 13R65 TaxID=3127458 RepID=UPI00301E4535